MQVRKAGHSPVAQRPERTYRPRVDPFRGAHNPAPKTRAERHLQADGVGGAAVAARGGVGAGGGTTIPTGPAMGRCSSMSVPGSALVLGLDLGARFLRGAICDLNGDIRARQDVELAGADAEGAIRATDAARRPGRCERALPPHLINGAVIGVPGVVDTDTGKAGASDQRSRARGMCFLPANCSAWARPPGDRGERHQSCRRRRALGGGWPEEWRTSCSSLSEPDSAPG